MADIKIDLSSDFGISFSPFIASASVIMKLLVVLCLLAVVAAAPPSARINYSPTDVHLLKFNNEINERGDYKYLYEQSDGQKAEQEGQLKNAGREDESLAVRGSYQWVGPDGVTYVVTYTADEEGYKPEIEQGPGGVPPGVVASLLG